VSSLIAVLLIMLVERDRVPRCHWLKGDGAGRC
jgi:hypothetical protein